MQIESAFLTYSWTAEEYRRPGCIQGSCGATSRPPKEPGRTAIDIRASIDFSHSAFIIV